MAANNPSPQPPKVKPSGLAAKFAFVVTLCCILIMLMNMAVHFAHLANDSHPHENSVVSESMKAFAGGMKQRPRAAGSSGVKLGAIPKKAIEKQTNTLHSQLASLQCDAYGGPSAESAQEMVYWSDIPSDAEYVSPFHSKAGERKRYMTFEPDGGGWNNIRMAMETVFGMAHAMGRILVLPPAQKMYLLGKNNNEQKKHFSFADFFPIYELAKEHAGLEIITMQVFLQIEAMTGNLIEKSTGKPSFPPNNRTDWDGMEPPKVKELKEWLRNVTHLALWKPDSCMASFPASGDHKDVVVLKNMVREKQVTKNRAQNVPVPVDGPTIDRMHENLQGRTELCVYDEAMQEEMVVHFMCYHKMRIRLLVHFYNFLFFEDWKQDMWTKRFIRDHVRYIDEIQCAAARVVEKVRERARKRDPVGNPQGLFDTFHIRRGDFQYKATRIEADDIFKNSQKELTPNTTIYVATDERDKTFFKALVDVYDVVFLDDFMGDVKGLNTNYYGMLDQLIASRGRVFFGTFFSTFTGYIHRMRGYHSVKDKLPGFDQGALPHSYYFAPINHKNEMLNYRIGRGFPREYPISWRDIDKGIGEL